MAVRVAINGFGRTGRAAFRAAYERDADVEWVAINDLAEPAMLAQLLRHDSVYGPFGTEDGSPSRPKRIPRDCPGRICRSTS
jgi:glyceraldehyde-3-phosphate dehydrogenase/erythrose-4-phosphate dehydrogenase